MNLMSRETEVLLSVLEQLSHFRQTPSSPEEFLERLLNGIGRVLAADQLVALVFDANGRELRVVQGAAVTPCQERWLRRRAMDSDGGSEAALIGREYWDETAGDERCLGSHLRSGALMEMPCGDNRGILLVAFNTDHLFSDQELSCLRIFANMGGGYLANRMSGGSDLPGRATRANRLLKAEVREHRRGKQALKRSERELQNLSRQRLSAQEDERQRISSELHDSIGQSLAAIKYWLEGALQEHEKSNGRVARATLLTTLHDVQSTIDEVRRVAMDLRPAMLDDLGLQPTLEWFCRQFEKTYRPLRVRMQFALGEEELDSGLRVPIYRICQEALNNVAKHARAEHVEVTLNSDDNRLVLRIADNGVGLNASGGSGFGLKSMRERAELSGGRLAITAGEPSGLCVEASWPLPERDLPHLPFSVTGAGIRDRALDNSRP